MKVDRAWAVGITIYAYSIEIDAYKGGRINSSGLELIAATSPGCMSTSGDLTRPFREFSTAYRGKPSILSNRSVGLWLGAFEILKGTRTRCRMLLLRRIGST